MREKSFTKIIFLSFLHFFFPISQNKNLKIKKNHFFHNFSQGKKGISHFHRLKNIIFCTESFFMRFHRWKNTLRYFFPSSSEIINTGEKNNIDHNLENGSLEKKNNSSLAPQDFCIILMQSDTWCRKSFSQRILGPLNYFAS